MPFSAQSCIRVLNFRGSDLWLARSQALLTLPRNSFRNAVRDWEPEFWNIPIDYPDSQNVEIDYPSSQWSVGMAKHPESLGQVQLEVLQFIAEHHPIRVIDVAEHFASKARTTILTVMEKLREKGYLTRKKHDGAFHYSPRLATSDVMAGVVRRFVEKSLGGSMSPFIAYLADSSSLTDEELAKLKNLVRDLESRNKENTP
jgi:predicted transcriptional regulator